MHFLTPLAQLQIWRPKALLQSFPGLSRTKVCFYEVWSNLMCNMQRNLWRIHLFLHPERPSLEESCLHRAFLGTGRHRNVNGVHYTHLPCMDRQQTGRGIYNSLLSHIPISSISGHSDWCCVPAIFSLAELPLHITETCAKVHEFSILVTEAFWLPNTIIFIFY